MKKFLFTMALVLFLKSNLFAAPFLLSNMPAYGWVNGCSPSLAAMIFGYWDLRGFDGLLNAHGWDEVKKTSNVIDEMQQLGDFMGTGQGSLGFGWTYVNKVDDGMRDFAQSRGYDFDVRYTTVNWNILTDEIDAGNPVKVGIRNHGMAAFGYEDRGEQGQWVATYNTYNEDESNISWYNFDRIVNMAWVHSPSELPPNPPSVVTIVNTVPEPATIVLIGLGLIGLMGLRSHKKKLA